MQKKNMRNKVKGISLIILVITIIIMIIIASVIIIAAGDSNIIGKANKAKAKYSTTSQKEFSEITRKTLMLNRSGRDVILEDVLMEMKEQKAITEEEEQQILQNDGVINIIDGKEVKVEGKSIISTVKTEIADLDNAIRFIFSVERSEAVELIERGSIIIPKDLIIGDLTLDTPNILKIVSTTIWKDEEFNYQYATKLTNINEGNYGRVMAGRGYIKYKDRSNKEKLVYSEIMYSSINELKNNQ